VHRQADAADRVLELRGTDSHEADHQGQGNQVLRERSVVEPDQSQKFIQECAAQH
jgi:hypothetical protein